MTTLFTWHLGPAKVHCPECASWDGVTMTQEDWLRFYPQGGHAGPGLAHWGCACSLLPTFAPDPFTCPECGEGFATQEALLWHLADKHQAPPPAPLWRCQLCQETFDSYQAYMAHIYEVHTPPPPPSEPFTCPYCGATYASQGDLDGHVATAHGGEPAPPVYTCSYCGASYGSEADLAGHIASAHGGDPGPGPAPAYTCNTCGAAFADPADLYAHIAAAHWGQPGPV